MLSKLCKKVANTFVSLNVINESERDLYEYGFFILFSNILYFSITIVFSLLNNNVMGGLSFYVSFMLLRRFAGGFHAKTELKCFLITVGIIILSTFPICNWLAKKDSSLILFITIIFASIIYILAPMDTVEKPLCVEEKQYFRKISQIITTTIILVIVIVIILDVKEILYSCCLSLILEGILLIIERIKRIIKIHG